MTEFQLENWRRRGLLPRNCRASAGQTSSTLPDGAEDLVVWLATQTRRGCRPADSALLAFSEGLAVPASTVRCAFRHALGVLLGPDDDNPAVETPEDREDRAAELAERCLSQPGALVVVPRRVRRIDDLLVDAGVDWSHQSLAVLDQYRRPAEPFTAKDFVYTAVAMIMCGPRAVPDHDLSESARLVLPRHAASPLLAMLGGGGGTMPWDLQRGRKDGQVLLPPGDLRCFLAGIVDEADLAILREAWRAAGDLRTWAERLCDAVEAELASGELHGRAIEEWVRGVVFVLPRVLLLQPLRDRRPSPSKQAVDAIGLLMIRNMLHQMHEAIPDAAWATLRTPGLLPSCLHEFLAPGDD